MNEPKPMTTHAAILAQLEKYEGGRFVPTKGGLSMRNNAGYYWEDQDWMEDFDAESHIERAAFRAVMHWCEERNHDMRLLQGKRHIEGGTAVQEMWVDYRDGCEFCCELLGSGPDEPAMWLAAMKYINGERA